MRRMFIGFLLVSLLSVSFSSYALEEETIINRNEQGEKVSGTLKQYYENRQLSLETTIVIDDDVFEVKTYRENGQLKSKMQRLNKENVPLHGKAEVFYETGELWKVTNYNNGKRDGLEITYYKNGNLMAKTEYKDDQVVGVSRYYFSNGELKIEWEHLPTDEARFAIFNDDGQLIKETKLTWGIKEYAIEYDDKRMSFISKPSEDPNVRTKGIEITFNDN